MPFIPAGTVDAARTVGTGNAAALATSIVEKGKPLFPRQVNAVRPLLQTKALASMPPRRLARRGALDDSWYVIYLDDIPTISWSALCASQRWKRR